MFWRLFNCFVECWKHLQLLNKSKQNCLNQKLNPRKHLVIGEKKLGLLKMKECWNVFINFFISFGKLMKHNFSLLKFSLIDEMDWIIFKPSCKLVKKQLTKGVLHKNIYLFFQTNSENLKKKIIFLLIFKILFRSIFWL